MNEWERPEEVARVGHAELFELGEDAVTLIDVAGVELEVLLVGLVGNLSGFPFTLARRDSCWLG